MQDEPVMGVAAKGLRDGLVQLCFDRFGRLAFGKTCPVAYPEHRRAIEAWLLREAS